MVIKCLCFDGVKNSENCTFRFRKLYVSFLRLYSVDFEIIVLFCCQVLLCELKLGISIFDEI